MSSLLAFNRVYRLEIQSLVTYVGIFNYLHISEDGVRCIMLAFRAMIALYDNVYGIDRKFLKYT
jgi:hypothetical protein